MERIMDLDEAVAAVTDRQTAWRAEGLTVGPVTWREAAAPWPQRLETDRAEVTDPDSIGRVGARRRGRSYVAAASVVRSSPGAARRDVSRGGCLGPAHPGHFPYPRFRPM